MDGTARADETVRASRAITSRAEASGLFTPGLSCSSTHRRHQEGHHGHEHRGGLPLAHTVEGDVGAMDRLIHDAQLVSVGGPPLVLKMPAEVSGRLESLDLISINPLPLLGEVFQWEGWGAVRTMSATPSLLLLRELLLELAGAVHRRALTELVELEDLADLDLTLRAVFTVVPVSAAGLERHPLRPLDGLRHGLRFD